MKTRGVLNSSVRVCVCVWGSVAATGVGLCLQGQLLGRLSVWAQLLWGSTMYICVYTFSVADLHPAQPERPAGWGFWWCLCPCECSESLSVVCGVRHTYIYMYIRSIYVCFCVWACWKPIFSLRLDLGTWRGSILASLRLLLVAWYVFLYQYQPVRCGKGVFSGTHVSKVVGIYWLKIQDLLNVILH